MATDSLHAPFKTAHPDTPNGTPPPAEVHATVMVITPDMAKEWLTRNTRNRNLRWALIDALVRDITAGQWVLNGETIKIAVDGAVIDGQHRLSAIIKADTPVQSFVIQGLPPEVQDTVDTGAVRKLTDQLTLRGEKNSVLLGSVTRWALLWEQGYRSKIGGTTVRVTHSEALTFLETRPELRDATAFASHARQSFPLIRASVYGMAWWLLTPISKERADEFLSKMVTGEDISAGHPAHTLRARFLSSSRLDERLTEFEQLALVVIAWNADRDARSIARVQLPKGGLTPKNFPEPK